MSYRYNRLFFAIWATVFGFVIRARLSDGGTGLMDFLSVIFPTSSDGWLMGLYGVGIGLFVIPWIMDFIEQNKQYEKFFQELRGESMGAARITYFKYLSRAYTAWQQNETDAPLSIEALIRSADFPSILPVHRGDVVAVIDQQYGDNPPPIWRFSRTLFTEIDNYMRKRKEPTLLLPDEVDEFHAARQRLSYFWSDIAELMIRWRKLRYRNIRRHVEKEERLLKSLSILGVELHRTIQIGDEGPKYLLYLFAIYNKTRPWKIRQWFWDPLAPMSENIRR